MMFIVFALNIIIEQNVRTQWISSIQYRWELSVMTNHQISLCNTPRLSCHWTCCSNMRLALCRYTTIVVSVSITECKTAQNVYMRVVILFITDEQLQNKPRRFGRRFALVVAEVVGAWRPKSRIPFAQFCLRWQHCQTRIYFRHYVLLQMNTLVLRKRFDAPFNLYNLSIKAKLCPVTCSFRHWSSNRCTCDVSIRSVNFLKAVNGN